MPIPLGILAVAGAGAAGGGAYDLLETTILTGTQATITFNSIPSTYKHLQVRITGRMASGGANGSIMRLNNDTTANYAWHHLTGDGSAVSSGAATSITELYPYQFIGSSGATGNFGASIIDILDYTSTSKNKTIRSLAGFADSAANRIMLRSGVWLSTAAVNRIDFTGYVSYVAGSRFSLYGVK